MSITITGGISFGGGVGITAAPPSTPTAAWFAGGQLPNTGNLSTVDRTTYATDTATATVRGPLNGTRYNNAGTGNLNYGWFAGSRNTVAISSVSRITYATDTDTASNRGPLSYSAYSIAATGTDTYGWFAGGQDESPSNYSYVSRITYATDTGTASTRGPLTSNARDSAATTDSTTYGWFAIGFASGTPIGYTSAIARITYATDTATATSRGALSLTRGGMGGTGSTSYGWFGGGYFVGPPTFSPNMYSRVDRIDYATDTATASVRGPLSIAKKSMATSTDSTTYGWFGGGDNGEPPNYSISSVDRITYATDTVTATARGPLSSAKRYLAASSGIQ
jgi:hypothetical protein